MSLVDPALDHRKLEAVKPTFRFSRLVANTGKTEVILQQASKQEIVWDLPVRPRNLSRTYLEFDLVVNTPASDLYYNKVWTKGMSTLNQMELRTRSGTEIVFVDNADQVYNALAPYCNRLENMLQHGTVVPSVSPDSAITTQTSMIHRSNALASATPLMRDGAQQAGSVNYTEEQHFAVGPQRVDATPASGATCIHYAIPLSEFFDTFLAEEQDSFFEEVVQLRLNFNEYSKCGWSSSSPTAIGTVAPLAGATIKNCYLMEALEVDPQAAKDIIRLVRGGKTQRIPFMHVHSEAINDSATQYNRQIKMNQASTGERVLRICHFTTNGGERDEKNMDTNNYNNGGVSAHKTSFFTSLDSLRLQEIDIQCGGKGDDYNLMKPYLKDSCLQSRQHYNESALWSDSFDGVPLSHCREADSVENGLKMAGVERTWQLQQRTPTGTSRQNYVVIVAQKQLVQQSGQILVN